MPPVPSWVSYLWAAGVLLLPGAVMVVDFVIDRRYGNDATLSRHLLALSARRRLFALAVAYALGLLCGHLFVQQTVAAPGP